ncbi:MAG: LON peptidase substrate-binding domain-containing protein [Gemmatimonadaceae bacterium]
MGAGAIPHDVGTVARIIQVEYLDEGRMNLFTIGEQRFRIIAVNTTAPYLRGEVEPLEQVPGRAPASPDLIVRAGQLFDDYLRTHLALGGQWTRGVDLPNDLGEAADYVAARLDVPPPQKQELLEQLAPEPRLTRALEIIAGELPGMRVRLAALQRQKTSGFGVLN